MSTTTWISACPARKFPQFLTLRQLLTHTAGFEDTGRRLFLAPDDKLVSLRDYVTARTRPPQLYFARHRHGLFQLRHGARGLRGRTRQRPTLRRLCRHACLRSAGHDALHLRAAAARAARAEPVARLPQGGRRGRHPLRAHPGCPSGGLSTTAGDMGRFMRMLLNGGTLDGKQILAPESVKAIFDRQHVAHTSLNAMGLVFYSSTEGERFIIGHGGDTVAFHSDMFPAARQQNRRLPLAQQRRARTDPRDRAPRVPGPLFSCRRPHPRPPSDGHRQDRYPRRRRAVPEQPADREQFPESRRSARRRPPSSPARTAR